MCGKIDKFTIDRLVNMLAQIGKTVKVKAAQGLLNTQKKSASRNAGIIAAYASGGYSLKEIGEYFSLH